jgi:hypothetical protein
MALAVRSSEAAPTQARAVRSIGVGSLMLTFDSRIALGQC